MGRDRSRGHGRSDVIAHPTGIAFPSPAASTEGVPAEVATRPLPPVARAETDTTGRGPKEEAGSCAVPHCRDAEDAAGPYPTANSGCAESPERLSPSQFPTTHGRVVVSAGACRRRSRNRRFRVAWVSREHLRGIRRGIRGRPSHDPYRGIFDNDFRGGAAALGGRNRQGGRYRGCATRERDLALHDPSPELPRRRCQPGATGPTLLYRGPRPDGCRGHRP